MKGRPLCLVLIYDFDLRNFIRPTVATPRQTDGQSLPSYTEKGGPGTEHGNYSMAMPMASLDTDSSLETARPEHRTLEWRARAAAPSSRGK